MMLVATTEEVEAISTWAKGSRKNFKPNGFGRQFGILYRKDLNVPRECWSVRNRVVEGFSLQGYPVEPMFKDYCGFITDGGAIHKHSDPDSEIGIHRRYNVMISKPHDGGVPYQDGVPVDVEEGEVWRCDASRVTHWCSPVVGDKPRIVLSFGFAVPV
jgi:hypothetical protein